MDEEQLAMVVGGVDYSKFGVSASWDGTKGKVDRGGDKDRCASVSLKIPIAQNISLLYENSDLRGAATEAALGAVGDFIKSRKFLVLFAKGQPKEEGGFYQISARVYYTSDE